MAGNRMKEIKSHFENEAGIFDERVLKIVPHYTDMIEALVDAVPFSPKAPIKVADLGCGTGTVSYFIKKRFPNARITCVDMSQNMLNVAAQKLRAWRDITYELAELDSYKFKEKFHAIVSSLALHHMERAGKADMRRKAYNALVKGGVFANADIVLAASSAVQKKHIEKWGDFVLHSYSTKDMHRNYRRYKREDKPAVLMEEVEGLKKAGFKNADVFFKFYNFAVYGGRK